jgi:hypothetical protein
LDEHAEPFRLPPRPLNGLRDPDWIRLFADDIGYVMNAVEGYGI